MNDVDTELNNDKPTGTALLAPVISIAAFLILMFGAGYAYFTSTTSMNTATYQINMPTQTSLVVSGGDCGVTITPTQMTQENANNTTAKSSNVCNLVANCSGTPGAKCNFNVTLTNATGYAAYVPTAGLGGQQTNKEFTIQITTMPSGCSQDSGSQNEVQVNTQNGHRLAYCNLTVPAAGYVNVKINATYRWYNVDLDQTTSHANHTYRYVLKAEDGTVG